MRILQVTDFCTKHINNKLILSIFFVLVGMYRTSALGLNRIPLEVFASQADIPAYPVEIGVPFPPKVISDASHIRLLSPEGKEIPCQVEVLSRYLDGSLRAVLLVFFSPVYKDRGSLYTIEFGSGVRRKVMPKASVVVSDKEGMVMVDSGVLRFQVGKGKGLFRELKVGSRKVCEGVEQFIQEYGQKELIFGSNEEVVVEERGPVRVVVLVRGKFVGGGDSYGYRVRIYMYNGGNGLMRIQQTVIGVDGNKSFELGGWGLRIPVVGVKKSECGVDGKGRELKMSGGSIFQDGEFRWTWGSLSEEERAKRLKNKHIALIGLKGDEAPGWEYRLLYSLNGGEMVRGKADGWMLCEVAGGGGIVVCVRDFWQQYPKEFAVSKEDITIWLHSPRGAGFIGKAGTAKTHEVLFEFGSVGGEQAKSLNGVYQDWPHARVSPEWVCSSGVFGPLLPRSDPFTAGYNTITDLFIEFIKQTAVKTVNRACWYKYGNGDFGDFYDGFPWNVPHGISREFIIEFLRGGDREWARLGARACRHYGDIDVCHAKTSESEIGRSWDSGTREHGYNYKRVPTVWAGSTHGFLPKVLLAKGEEKSGLEAKIKIIEEDFISSKSPRDVHQCVPGPHGVLWCFHTGGAMPYFLLSGDRRAKEVLIEQAEWILQVKDTNRAVKGVPSILLSSLLDAHEATGEAKYLQGAHQVVSNIVFNSKGYRKHGEGGIVLASRQAVSLYRFWELNNTEMVHSRVKNDDVKQKFAVATAESMVSRQQADGCTPAYISAWVIAWDTGFWSEETRSIFEGKILPIISFDRKGKPPPVLRYKIPFLQYKWSSVEKKTGEFVTFEPLKLSREGYLFNRHLYNFTCDYAECGIMYAMPGYPHFVAVWKKYHEKYLKPRMDANGILEFNVVTVSK